MRRAALYSGARDAETIVRLLELGGNARARGAARNFGVVPPGASARSATRARRWALGIAIGSGGVVVRVEPIRAPLVHVGADIKKTVIVAFTSSHRLGTGLPARRIIQKRFGRIITPGKLF